MEKIPEKEMLIIDGNCWKRNAEMKVAIVAQNNGQYSPDIYGPESFSAGEIKLAEQQGVVVQEHFSATRNEHYFANTCPECRTFLGQHYLFLDYFCEAVQYQSLNYLKVPI
ncbi:hypothetical protein [Pedobacter jeongneungensis]|uniref:hypothetical protein n=1 Tax=Pedobacter jeongneungensis TaxID=947309 RepID=UPI000469F807|nr:hypothetical protein [Pedobacter jeongneungensis]